MKNDYSKEIFEKYFSVKNKTLVITLNDGTVLEGFLVSFSHGDEGSDDPFIVRWHFVDQRDMSKYEKMFSIGGEETGRSLEQRDIKNVHFND